MYRQVGIDIDRRYSVQSSFVSSPIPRSLLKSTVSHVVSVGWECEMAFLILDSG